MTLRFALLTAAAAFHLVLVASAASHIRLFSPRIPAGRAIENYATLAGANNGFAFFAPAVAPQFTVTFTLTDDQGQTWVENGDQGATHEANLRYQGVTSMFVYERFQERVGASWAAALFGKYPHVRQVEILVEAENMPTMKHYVQGARPVWDTVYSGSFVREGNAE
jgi:hypothetical protein